MKTINQISVFSENKPGKLEKVTGALLSENISIRAITIASSENFGIIKFLVDRCEEAYELLKKKGYTCALNEILAIEVDDRPGGLHKVAELFTKNRINIENASGFVIEAEKKAVILIEVGNIGEAKKLLANEPLTFLGPEEILKK